VATFVLIHGAGDGGWSWHLLEPELRALGHDVVAPDLPAGDDSAHLSDYVDAVAAAVGDRRDLVVVGQSFGGITAPLVVDRLGADALVFVAGMIPVPGQAPDDWWTAAGYPGSTGDDAYETFLHDVPRPLAEEALRRERAHPCGHLEEPWPLAALPDVPTRFVLGTRDRFFPPGFLRRLVAERLPGVVPEEIATGHCPALARPAELARLLAAGPV
jgi:dienelactone hydrolase